MHPQNELLTKFTLLAKHIIYDAGRMRKLLDMLGTPEGAVIAVHTVLGAIEQAKPIPPAIVHQLAFNAYVLMVDNAQKITGKKADPAKMKQVTEMIMHATNQMLVSPKPGVPQLAPMPAATKKKRRRKGRGAK